MLTIHRLAASFGLTIEYLDLPAKVCGYLDPHDEPRYIAVNRSLPRSEEVFTIAHEIAHHEMRLISILRNKPVPKYSQPKTEQEMQFQLCHIFADEYRRNNRKLSMSESAVDNWAMVWLLIIGATDDLSAYLKSHPEKCRFFHGITRDARKIVEVTLHIPPKKLGKRARHYGDPLPFFYNRSIRRWQITIEFEFKYASS